jgi:hypothetical protein
VYSTTLPKIARNTSALPSEGFCPDQEQKIPGNPKISEAFPARKSLISDFKDSRLGTGDHLLPFLTVYYASLVNIKIL